ncbi:MAG: thiamine phosphate synthase [Pirellulaceae bacterium]|nr:thiamine phosphate synthase [Pirellulaceae bacterium]
MSDTIDPNTGWWRILDANFNRCGEGLRAIEDWCRFVANELALSKLAKDTRHQLHELSAEWSLTKRLTARDVPSDVGRTIKTTSESQRPDDISFLQANFYRVQQSLRVLEETAKHLQLSATPVLEHLRYRSYELQQRVVLRTLSANSTAEVTDESLASAAPSISAERKSLSERLCLLDQATLYVLTDSCGGLSAYQQHVRQLVASGVDVIQLRDKKLSDHDLWEYSLWTAQELASSRTLFIANDRPDIAAAAKADGVHVGQAELPVEVARQIVGPQGLVGISTHDLAQVTAAHDSSANYLGLGPVFPSTTKGFAEFAGLDTIRQCVPALERPTFAIGGINEHNVEQVYATGITRIAVQAALAPGKASPDAARQLRQTTTRQ